MTTVQNTKALRLITRYGHKRIARVCFIAGDTRTGSRFDHAMDIADLIFTLKRVCRKTV